MALGQVRTARAAADGRGAAGLAPRQGDLGAHQLQVRLRHGGTAEHIRQRLDSSFAPGQLEALLEQDGVVRPGRWLRSLRDVGLVQRQADRWALPPDGGILRLP